MKKKVFLFINLFVFISNYLFAQCQVSLGNDRTICLNTEITLTANGNAVLYEWSTGQSGNDIVVSPLINTEYIIYATCGDGTETSDTLIVYVNPLPNVFIGEDTEICLNDSIILSSSAGINFLWSNNSTESSINISPTVTTNYWVIATDINNCQNSDTIEITVNPLPVLTISDDQEICQGDFATLTVTTNATTYLWNTNETTSAIVVNPYITSNYVVFVTDQNNCTNSDTTKVTVHLNPTSDFNFENTCQLSEAEFQDLSTDPANQIIEWTWFFGDGNSSIIQNPSNIYLENGVFNVSLIVKSNKNCKDSTTKSIIIYEKPTANFILNYSYNCNTPANVITTNLSTNSVEWLWNFDNGQQSTNQNPIITYNNVGEYTIQLISFSEQNCSDTTTKIYNVYQKPIASFSTNITEGCEPLEVEFYNQSQFADNINWYINDSLMFGDTVKYTFTRGDYKIFIQATNNLCIDINDNYLENYIFSRITPKAEFELNIYNSCYKTEVIETNNKSIDESSYEWDFGDNSEYYLTQNTFHNYDSAGIYNIRLVVGTDYNCTDTFYREFELYQQTYANFISDKIDGCEDLNVIFEDKSLFNKERKWFIDNYILNDSVIEYIFDEGIYDIKIIVSNENCSDTIDKKNYITVYNKPEPNFYYSVESNPFPFGLIYIQNLTLNGNYYFWDFGDTTSTTEFEPEHRYDTYGEFNITHISIDTVSGCSDTLIKIINIEYFDGLHLPTLFLPETGAGEDRLFLPKGKHLIEYKISVFNNYGNLVWQSNLIENGSPTEGWDGTFNGKNMPQGVYFWTVDATFENNIKWKGQQIDNGKYSTSGYVTLIR